LLVNGFILPAAPGDIQIMPMKVRSVADEEKVDDLLSKRAFERGDGVDLGSFIITPESNSESDDTDNQSKPESEEDKHIETDEAMGDISEIFSADDSISSINRDGTVDKKPEMDSVTSIAVKGEKRLHFGLMIAMVITWSVIGAIVGTALNPTLGATGLLSMAVFGLYLGERWIPRSEMHLLGVTWIIISMKLLYGLAIDAYHWDWIDANQLGIALLSIIALNIYIAQRHDEDAIAAQATLVLLAVGSAAGALYGEFGVAIMIAIGTVALHGMALLRNSGNLASLGIASSNIWVGLHALSDNWYIFDLQILSFENPLHLFLLMCFVTSLNAVMATRFARESNWFSKALSGAGIGNPGLWSVSVGLGMIGALMAIAAHRTETGYALAQLIMLLSAFGASYLVVRGVSWTRLAPFILWPSPLLITLLILLVNGQLTAPSFIGPYAIFAAIAALLTAGAFIRDQSSVSNHVLWTGSIVIVILLTLLIPASNSAGGARILLISQALLWCGLAGLAIKRQAPSLAGTAVLAPWLWLMIFATDLESRIISDDLILMSIDIWDLSYYMLLLIVMQIPINLSLGKTGVNLAAGLVGLSEIGARLRDSGLLRLWNLGFIFALLTILMIARPDGLPAFGLIGLMGILLFTHSTVIRMDRHQGTPRIILGTWALTAIILQWRFGFASAWILQLTIGSWLILSWSDRLAHDKQLGKEVGTNPLLPGQLITLVIGLMALMALIISLEKVIATPLIGSSDFFTPIIELRIFTITLLLAIAVIYLPRAPRLEKLLPPALASTAALVAMLIAASVNEDTISISLTVVGFVSTGAWLAAQGEIRSGLAAVAEKKDRIQRLEAKRELVKNVETSSSGMKMIDPELLELESKQQQRAVRRSISDEYDLEAGDIHHQPTIVITFILVTIFASAWLAYGSDYGLLLILFASALSILFIAIARWRSSQIGLQLPDFAGIEMPIAIAMGGLALIHITGRLSSGVVEQADQWSQLTLFIALISLAGIGLLGRDDLGLRLPSALEGVILLMVIARVITALMGVDSIRIDPTFFSQTSWRLPFTVIEVSLLSIVALDAWVENERRHRGMPDHRGAAGRLAWMAIIAMISVGPAALLVACFSAYRGWNWLQPGVVVGAALVLVWSWSELSFWIEPLKETTALVSIAIGGMAMILVAWSIQSNNGLWTASGIWISHLLLPAAIFAFREEADQWLVVAILIVSMVAWISGVLTLRRGFRTLGAVDLLLAWLIAGKLLIAGASILMALTMLIATAVLLGVVTWLSQAREEELAIT
jgi:hypothetical protein